MAKMVEVKRTFVEPIGATETITRYIGKLVVVLCAKLAKLPGNYHPVSGYVV